MIPTTNYLTTYVAVEKRSAKLHKQGVVVDQTFRAFRDIHYLFLQQIADHNRNNQRPQGHPSP